MPIGASWQFNDQLDGPNLDDVRVNSLDVGLNAYQENGFGLTIAVTAGRFTSSLGFVDFAGATGVAIPASTVGRAVWVDTAGAIQQGAAFPGTEHYAVALVDTSGTDVILITDRRPRAGVTNIPAGAPTGPAGGDLAGAYPNPTVVLVGGIAAATVGAHPALTSNPHAVTAVQAGAIPIAEKAAALGVASLNGASLVVEDPASKGLANGVASLNGAALVVENPASSTTVPTPSAIPIATAAGRLDGWVTPLPSSLSKLYVPSGGDTYGSKLQYPKAVNFVAGGVVQYMQIFLPSGISIDRVETFLDSGGVNGESVRYGLYDQAVPTDPAGLPSARLQQTAVRVLNGGDDGSYVVELLTAPAVIATSGFYWVAMICSGALSLFAGSEVARAGFLSRREEVSAGATLPVGAGVLTNPQSAAVYAGARAV